MIPVKRSLIPKGLVTHRLRITALRGKQLTVAQGKSKALKGLSASLCHAGPTLSLGKGPEP